MAKSVILATLREFTRWSDRLNSSVSAAIGKAGYTFIATATDQGEPGRRRDTFKLVIQDARGMLVASVDEVIDGGNIQSTRLGRFGY